MPAVRTSNRLCEDDTARNVRPQEAAQRSSSDNRLALLADPSVNFPAVGRNEWTADGRNCVDGLFRMLHTHGALVHGDAWVVRGE